MKKIRKFLSEHKFVAFGLSLLIAVVLFLVGKDDQHSTTSLATVAAGAVALTEAEKEGFSQQEQNVLLAVKKLTVELKRQVDEGKIDKNELGAAVSGLKKELSEGTLKELKDQLKEIEDAATKQGVTLNQLSAKLNGNDDANFKSIAAQLKEDEDKIREVYKSRNTSIEYLITVNSKGEFVMKPHDPTKAAGPHASVGDVGTSGNAASIASNLDAATILRLGGQAPIVSQYRNSPWIFNLCNLVSQSFANPFAIWYDEEAKDGASTNVAEGGTKPTVQYKYSLNSSQYRKEAMLVSFTDEFSLDYQRLQEDILGKARIDLINRINSAILPRVISAATAYNTGTQFGTVAGANDFDALAAMAAQVENATFSTSANSAIMSTFRKHKLGITKNSQGSYLNPPASLSNLSFVGNPDMSSDNVLVGDFMNYNIILRGGMILRIGYNGTDFANNMFSTVLEQYYFDYISNVRKAAIVKGPDFDTVKAAITA